MPVKMQPTSTIIANLGLEPNGRIHAFFTNTCYKHMDKYVPKRKGNLRKAKVETDKIIYKTNYAKIQYEGIIWGHKVPKENYTTPGTGRYWDKRMWSIEKNDVIKEVQDFLDRGA